MSKADHSKDDHKHGKKKPADLKAEINQRQQTEEELKAALAKSKRHEAEVSALLESSGAILKHAEFEGAARAIFDSCKKLIGATAGYVALLSEDGTDNEVVFLEPGGLSCTVDTLLPMPIRGLRGEAYANGCPVYDNDFWNSKWMKLMPAGHVPLENVLFGPLVLEGKAVDLLGIANKPGGFNDNDLRLASAFADMAAIALNNSRLLRSLKDREARFHSIAGSAMDAIITIDANSNVSYWNRAAETMFGYPAEEMIDRPLTSIMPERFRQAHLKGLKRVVSTNKSTVIGKTVELTGLRKDGSEFPVELSLSTWDVGDKRYFSGIVRDITERKKIEDIIQKKQQEVIQELSIPILQISPGLLVVPLIGEIDNIRAHQLTQRLLEAIREERAKVTVLDITGVPFVNADIANHLVRTAGAARLMGTTLILTGLSGKSAQTLAKTGTDIEELNTRGDLQSGIEAARRLLPEASKEAA